MKFLKLCYNEHIKTIKKTSTKILIIFTLLAVILGLGFTFLIKTLNKIAEDSVYVYTASADDRITEITNQLKEKDITEQTKNELKAQLETYKLAKECDIKLDGMYPYWRRDALFDLQANRIVLFNLQSFGDSDNKIPDIEAIINKLTDLIKNDNFVGYIEYQKNLEKIKLDNKQIKQDEYDINIEKLDLKAKYEAGKNEDSEEQWKLVTIEEIATLKHNILTGIDKTTGKVLTIEKLNEQKDAILLDYYRLEHNIPVMSTGAQNYRDVFDSFAMSFSSMFLAILMIMIAGTAISNEVSKGTIKFWLITPNKRWKILLAKIVSAVCLLLVISIIVSLFSEIIGTIAFSDNPAGDYLYVKDGEVKAINHTIYMILYNLVQDIGILFFMLFAFMLSTVTRSSAMSIGLSIGTYIGGDIIMAIINSFVKYDFVKFIPLNNLSLVDKVFPNSVSYLTMQMASSMTANTTLGFSLAVLGVCAFLMIVTMFDSFTKRDIM